jgi:hypothetical protein
MHDEILGYSITNAPAVDVIYLISSLLCVDLSGTYLDINAFIIKFTYTQYMSYIFIFSMHRKNHCHENCRIKIPLITKSNNLQIFYERLKFRPDDLITARDLLSAPTYGRKLEPEVAWRRPTHVL